MSLFVEVDSVDKGCKVIINLDEVIEIGDDVWIGHNALFLSGVKVGQGAIIGAGSVVRENVAPYAIVIGNPAKVIKYRFDDFIIDNLLKIDFSKISPLHLATFYQDGETLITKENVLEIVKQLSSSSE